MGGTGQAQGEINLILSDFTTSAGATITFYDSTGTTAGNILDTVIVTSNVSTSVNRFIPIKARKGIVSSIVNGTGAVGSVFFAPRG